MIIDGWVGIGEFDDTDTPALAALRESFSVPDGRFTTSPDALLAVLADAGIDHAVMAVRLGDTPLNRLGAQPMHLEPALEVCRTVDRRLSLMAQVTDPHDVMGMCRALRAAAEQPEVKAALVTPFALERYINDACLYPVYATCVDLGLPVIINAGICGPPLQSKYQDPMLLEDILVHFPELKVIIGHGGHPYERLIIRLMAKFRHLYVMTSAWMPKYLDPVLVEFMGSTRGRGRVVFGSDWPILDPKAAIKQARALPLDDAARDGYLGGNIRSILDL